MPCSRFVQGSIHQGSLGISVLSASFGTQCTAIALIALVFACFKVDVTTWESQHLDTVVFEGDTLYNSIVQSRYDGDATVYLGHQDLPLEFTAFGARYQQRLGSTFHVAINNRPAVVEAGGHTVIDALEMAFNQSPWLIGTFGGRSVALFRSNVMFFVFDSHSRNAVGQIDSAGRSILLCYDNVNVLSLYLSAVYPDHIFNISPVQLRGPEELVSAILNEPVQSTEHVEEMICDEAEINTFILPTDAHVAVDSVIHEFDHTYHALPGNKPKGKSYKKQCKDKDRRTIGDLYASQQTQLHGRNMSSVTCELTMCSSDVAAVCNISTSDQQRSTVSDNTNVCMSDQTNQDYESYIRSTPKYWCKCCDRFLFSSQVKHLGCKNNSVIQALKFNSSTQLCHTCYKYVCQGTIPPLSSELNALGIDYIPNEISSLSSLEKKLLARIQVCMTVILLPGGQYAEKGLIVDMPRDVESFVEEITGIDNMCLVQFEFDSTIGSRGCFLTDPFKVVRGFVWLKANNRLYANTRIADLNLNSCNSDDSTICSTDFPVIRDTVSCLEHVTFAPVEYCSNTETGGQSSLRNTNLGSSVSSQASPLLIPLNDATPVSIYEMPFGEEKAFPWLFPSGKFGFTYPRRKSIQPSLYFRYRLNNRHGYWRRDISYMLHAAVSYDKHLLKKDIGICMKMRKGFSDTGPGLPTTAADVRSRNTDPDILQNLYMFMKNIRGTVAYFRNALYDLLAMFRCLGPPTLFMTLSADDLHWPELGMLLENLSYAEAVSKHSFFSSMRKDPLMTAIHFDRRFTALMKYVIHGPVKPLGIVKDFFARVEFRNRGSPHYHIFFWVGNVPNDINENTSETVLQYITNTIHTHIPLETENPELYHLVKKLQTHSHSNYCMRSGKHPCRFGFPKRECIKSRLLSRVMTMKNRGQFYETYRPKNSAFINAYNPQILLHWRANMDVQLINDADGAAYYVCHYLCKSEPDELRCALGNLINTVFHQNLEMTVFQRLWNIGLCVLKHRQVSAQEAAFHLSHLKLIQCSRSVVYLNIRPQNKRFKMLKPLAEIEAMNDTETDIFMHNIIDYYMARPQSMETVSLHFFASWFAVIHRSSSWFFTCKVLLTDWDSS